MFKLVRSSPLFSIRRLVFCLVITVFVVTTDVLFIHLKDIQTAAGFATEVAVYTLGFYGGFTITALSNQSSAAHN
ncbi:hypothetical protein AUR66_20070 [Haloferax profundi]|uniref:Uncharacterized protein n=1 Tax=Haloferax profundi TaxID=1544718 RepID=A0A0W1RD01_9EURY|nr:hypothetical protein AUR66_20070 [Haloferax profundi]